MARGGFFKSVRVALLLLILLVVAVDSLLARLRSTDWNEPLWLVIYPVNGDGSESTQRYIEGLGRDSFEAIETFMAGEARRHGLALGAPVTVRLAAQPSARPPPPPQGGSILPIMLWSLRLRLWAHVHDTFDGPDADVQMFVVYHDPATHDRLQHSLGLQKGLIGVVNAYAGADLAQRNNVVIAHELLHTLGASDKYAAAGNLPLYPIGYAEPDRVPLHPQRMAEIMGGRIPLSEQQAAMPDSLLACTIGPATALEIRWTD